MPKRRLRFPSPEAPPAGAILPGRTGAVCIALFLATLAGFWSVLPRTFVNYDDDVYVTANPHVQEGLSAEGIAWALTTTHGSNWHPLTWMSHMLDVQSFGLDAAAHHRTSLVLHAANAVLLFLVLLRMTGALGRSVLVAALFALHPLHVESFAWIAERKDVLSTLFWMVTLLAWLRYLERPGAGRYGVVLLAFAAGLMAKPMPVTLPFALLLLDVWPLGRLPVVSVRRTAAWLPLIREKLPLFAMSAASCVVTVFAQRSGGALQSLEQVPFAERLANALVAYVAYLGKIVWPSSLAVYYPHHHIGLLSAAALSSAIALAAVTFAALRCAGKAPYLATGWLWYLGTLVPVIGLVQVGGQAMADRYTYVPAIGIFIAAVWGIGALVERASARARAAAGVAAAAVLVALAVAARAQVRVWADRTALFTHALAVTSDNWLAHGDLATTLANEGRTNDAVAHLEEAIRIYPRYAEAHYNLGLDLAKLGRTDEAVTEMEAALAIRPDFAQAHNNLAAILAGEGQIDAALVHLREAIRLDPESEAARYNMGNVLRQTGRPAESIEHYEAALALKPDDVRAIDGLGLALLAVGRAREAIPHFDRELRLRPGSAEARENLRRAQEAAARGD